MQRNAQGTPTIMTRTASRFAAVAGLLIVANACSGDETATGPEKLSGQPTTPVLDLQPSGLSGAFSTYTFVPFTNDVHGANDYSGQNDVNQLSRADNDGKFGVAWTWDETDAWTGTGQTGDACSLFDTDATGATGAGNVDFALCVRVTNLNGNPANPVQAEGSPILYQCSDKKNDRCTTTVVPIPKGTTFCEVLKTTSDAFPGIGADGADVMAACGVDLSAISTTIAPKFLNVCSYPSGSPNSNPFDCILTPGAAFLKIVKATGSSTATNTQFTFTLSPGAQNGNTSFDVTDANAGNDESTLIPISPSQSYNLSEVSEPGWSLSSASCTGGTANGTPNSSGVNGFRVGVEGNTIVCTFVNAQNGSITVIKDAKPNADQDFSYTVTGGLSAFDLDDDGDNTNTLKSSKEFASLAAGKRTITESATTGWKITNIDCGTPTNSVVKYGVGGGSYTHTSYVDGDNSVEIDLASGENVSCTFENTKVGSITIVKNADPNHTDDFGFTTTGDGVEAFSLDDDGDNNNTLSNTKPFTGLLPGVRRITESAVAGWSLTDITCSGSTSSTVTEGADYVEIDLKNGESVSCTFTNTKHGAITIVKDAVPNSAAEFSYTTTNLSPATFTLVDDGNDAPPLKSIVFPGLLPGTYGVAEDGESGWALTGISCPGAGSATIGATSVSIVLAAGENVTCTFENTQGGSITIIKDALPNDPQDFAFSASGAGVSNFELDDDGDEANTLKRSKVFSGLQPGQRTISETVVTAWGKLTGISCDATVTIGSDPDFDTNDNSVVIDLAAGQNVTCTFVNTRKPTVVVDKSTDPTPKSIPETGGSVKYDVVVTNTSGYQVTLTTLTDDGVTLHGVGTCVVPQVLAASGAGATYTCTFTRNLPAQDPGSHTNVVEAIVQNVNGDTGSDTDDATVTITDVLPAITVSKNATLGTFTGPSGTLPAAFLSTVPTERRFTTPPNPPAPGDPLFASSTCDDKGANDINSSQVDLNCFNRADNLSGKIVVRWTWDGTDDWGGGGSTGDGCALIDTGTDGKADLAICARITNATGPITQVPSAGAADVYTCSSTKTERCANPSKVVNIGSTNCTIQANEPNGFPTGDDGFDTQATCEIYLNMPGAPIPASSTLTNVCSFPSGEPNSNPFDCVVTAGSGFIQIVKATNFTTTTLFGFTLGSTAQGTTPVNYAVQGGITSALIPVLPTSGQTRYTLVEVLPTTGWVLSTATCTFANTNTSAGTFNATNQGFGNIVVETGRTTVCTFTNNGEVTGPATYTVVVTNSGTVEATVSTLTDDKFGNLLSFPVNECPADKTLLPTETYTCVFTRTLTGLPGATHTNVVTARATDKQGNLTPLPAVTATKTVTLPTP